jgi:hypothetical protein
MSMLSPVSDQFALDHAAGSMQLSASMMPCLIVPPAYRPRWAPSAFAYGLHLRGDSPLPSRATDIMRTGSMMEPVAARLLRAYHGITITTSPDDLGRVRRHRADLPAVTYLDGLVDDETATEIKNVRSWVYRDNWASGPPLWIKAQAQAQMLIDPNLARILIVPVVIGSDECPRVLQVYEEPRDPAVGEMLLETGLAFLEMLRDGELPDPDETVSSYDAMMRTFKIDRDETVVLADDHAAEMFRMWQVDKLKARSGEDGEKAAKRYFAARAGPAAVIEIPGIGRIERKAVEVAAEMVPRPSRTDIRWILKEEEKA